MLADQAGFRRCLQSVNQLVRLRRPADKFIHKLTDDIAQSRARKERRQANLPKSSYPDNLPVVVRRREIARFIARHQVVVICGETGSGKTTQLPKICLELGRGVAGMIGHTQPRRIAARSVAARISQELNSPLGIAIGYKVRFSDKLSVDTYLKVMTDGILLAETQSDPLLEQYDTLIIDEAHERSLNIDFLLGYIKKLLPRRPDLKIIITSATIDPERFSDHFDGAPIIMVSGRTYPVEVRYRPLQSEDPDEEDVRQIDGILSAVEELSREGPGDILVFLSGEREIRETTEALRKHHPPDTEEILPLYARLSYQEQSRIFQSHRGRRIILATNVAETSLTVPGIHYVIDPGYARISRYNARTKVQRLPIEEISQASANQRKGRCGRVAAGICIRLYSEEDFQRRAEFMPPEILRTNLASVILQMKALRLGELSDFPFVESPDSRMIKDGYQTLQELQAIDGGGHLTPLGHELARLPIDPRLGRMVLAARDEECLDEILVIASALSVQDPRERPLDEQVAADEAHVRFRDENSDFLSLLKLWEFYHEHARHLSTGKLRKLCRTNFLSFIRIREWHDIYQQLRSLIGELHVDTSKSAVQESAAVNSPPRGRKPARPSADVVAKHAAIHRALLTGLLSSIGMKTDAYDYIGTRCMKFFIFPGSGLFQVKPQWIVAAELVETTKLYARTVARIQPEWVERLAAHLVTRTYSDPHWHEETARVLASERVTLYDLPIVEKRTVHFGPIDPKTAREIFIHNALVEGQYESDALFLRHNRRLIEEIETLEAKSRQRDVLVDIKARFDFYDARIPAGIYAGAAFEAWRRQVERQQPKILFMTPRDLMLHDASRITQDLFPDVLAFNDWCFPLEYHLEPGHPDDGVTVTIPLADLHVVPAERFEWLVPGFLREKILALIRSMPKSLRTNFVPAPEFAQSAFDALTPDNGSLLDSLAAYLSMQKRARMNHAAFHPEHLPDHFLMNFKIVDEGGKPVAAGRSLGEIRQKLGVQVMAARDSLLHSAFNRDNVTKWDFGDLPESLEVRGHGLTLLGFPAILDRGGSVSLRLLETPDAARHALRGGLRRLYLLDLADQIRHLLAEFSSLKQMSLHYASVGTASEFKTDLAGAIIDRVFLPDVNVRTSNEFARRKVEGKGRLLDVGRELADVAGGILSIDADVRSQLSRRTPEALADAVEDMRDQIERLVYKWFLSETPAQWLGHLPRYLNGILIRHKKLGTAGLITDNQRGAIIGPLWNMYKQRREKHTAEGVNDPELELYRWMLEEMRVSLFAQELKTSIPISEKRLEMQWMKVRE